MGNAFYARAQSAKNTKYETFAPVHSQRAGGNSDGVIDPDTGKSPIMRVLHYAFSWEDLDSDIVHFRVPAGTLVKDLWIQNHVAFGAINATLVDGAAASWLGATSMNGAAGSIVRDITTTNGLLLAEDGDGKYYPDGTTLALTFASTPAAGQAILCIACPSYHEPLGAEWL